MFFRFNSYSFKPTYENKNLSKFNYLKNKYQDVILKYINNKEKLNKDEQLLFFFAIEEISVYITNGIFFQITKEYDKKTDLDKKMYSLFTRINYYHENTFADTLAEDIYILSTNSIYEALGINGNNKFQKVNKNSCFISYTKNRLYYKVLNFLEKKCQVLNNIDVDSDNIDVIEKQEDMIDELIKIKKLDQVLDEKLIKEIKEALLIRSIPKHIIPYIEFLSK
jgi:hypothetical protein